MTDLTSPKNISAIARHFNFTFKKGLGQNFLTSKDVLEKIVLASDCADGVIEIGPGFGVLTKELSKSSKKVVALEIDERLNDVLQYTLDGCDNVKIINCDVMKADIAEIIKNEFNGERVSVAANLPYYITTPILVRLIEGGFPLKSIVVMIQKEVAERLAAKPATKDYGAISVLCAYYCKTELIASVPPSFFVPPPKVDSAVLKLTFLDKPAVSVKDEKLFFKTVKAAFSQRRKTLLNCFNSFFSIPKEELKEIFAAADIDPVRRGETLSLEEFANLADTLADNMKS